MPDLIGSIVSDCRRYWLDTNVPRGVADEMQIELEAHLRDAQAEGRSPESVVGPNVPAFAEEWARETRVADFAKPPAPAPNPRLWTYALLAGVVLVVAVLAVATAGNGDAAENAVWRWVWTIGALALGIAEIFTAGFFLLPFGVGAAAAAALAWIGSPLVVQWIAMFGVSAATLVYFQRFARRSDEGPHDPVGVDRLIGQTAVVLETIDPRRAAGMVRVETEQWRATSLGETIEKNAVVEVIEIRGTRLVVREVVE